MEEVHAIFGILLLVVVSAGAVIVLDSLTGQMAYNGYSGSKLYGPGLKRAQVNAATLGKAYVNSVSMESYSMFMEANKDKAECVFDSPDGPNPCVFSEEKQKWCCLKYAPLGY